MQTTLAAPRSLAVPFAALVVGAFGGAAAVAVLDDDPVVASSTSPAFEIVAAPDDGDRFPRSGERVPTR